MILAGFWELRFGKESLKLYLGRNFDQKINWYIKNNVMSGFIIDLSYINTCLILFSNDISCYFLVQNVTTYYVQN